MVMATQAVVGGSIWSFMRKLLPSMTTVSAPWSTRSKIAEVTVVRY